MARMEGTEAVGVAAPAARVASHQEVLVSCSPAPACKAALAEATRIAPARSRASDGICGDDAHQARESDHNDGNAFDLTHDPAHGVDAHAWAERLRSRVLDGTERRVKYIISKRRIFNPSVSREWRPYSGTNPHEKHAHVSITTSARGDVHAWWPGEGSAAPAPTDGDDMYTATLVHKGDVAVLDAKGKSVLALHADANALFRVAVFAAGKLAGFDPGVSVAQHSSFEVHLPADVTHVRVDMSSDIGPVGVSVR